MVKHDFIPERGDIVSLEFTPQSGKEQAGIRPALVLSPKSYNQRVGLALFCPITKKKKGYPFEVELPKNMKTCGVILVDHIKSLDWRTCNARFIEKLPNKEFLSVTDKIELLLK
ncbi:MAG: type II toxin-antitoxin system PemK/MazF family toxin [Candidatus Peribacteraceae bacterium]|nr:type II toxin-antitoxin system PemK/MazF family toxin [Candidatus Peribacteraceae bacterium]